ncbi:dihydroorotate dehydrogenase electron transfer subunit [Salibaculum halophilum]|uniref:dihydroorotate dehydrogenase electron transfer subunit n=1 Tax=Salibaculum halophilum TaxID=1914408 RepID=UPI000A11FB93|nr:dihydroorotate dehydrogenase electron transfer subunit [Salibaculum halophilum]
MLSPAQLEPSKERSIHEVVGTVVTHRDAASGYRLLELDVPQEALDCRPGQFFHILCPVDGQSQPFLRRPMSIFGYDRDAGRLSFLYKVSGIGTAALSGLDEGDRLNVVGPLGNGFTIPQNARHLVLVARGVGLATLAPLAQEARRLGLGLKAICSARSPEHLMSIDHFRALGAEVIPVTDSEGTSDPEQLRSLLDGLAEADEMDMIYTCGSNRLLKLCQQVGRDAGIPGEIALEQQMACAIGMCQCCVRPFRRGGAVVQERVCREGPVFDIQEAMEW